MTTLGTRAEQIQQLLEKEIFTGVLPPGTRLDEMELARRLNVSRTPVREALRHLGAAGLVEIRNRQSAMVIRLSAHRIIEMFQVMAELEGLCAKLAARRITAIQVAKLRQFQKELEQLLGDDDVERFYDVNREFHECIYEAAQNEFLAMQTKALRNRVGSYRRMVTKRPAQRQITIVEHDAVLNCIAQGDGDGAARAMQAHVNLLGEKLLDFLAVFEKLEAAAA